MKNTTSLKGHIPFSFVLEELGPLRPTIKRMFGFTYVYLDHKLLFSLRDSVKQPGTNGIWIYTTAEHLESLAREFPQLPKRQLWRSGKNCWVVLASRLEDFEEYAFKACELVLKGDQRVGRVTRREEPRRNIVGASPRGRPKWPNNNVEQYNLNRIVSKPGGHE